MGIGAPVFGLLADIYGRKKVFLASNILLFVFGVLSAFSVNYYMLLSMRCLVGFSLGGSHVGVTLFTEFTPSGKRGICLVLLALFFSMGGLLETLLAWAILPSFGQYSWRYESF
jgi:MFS family permease